MPSNITNIALSGLNAAQAALAVTANNISNQGTTGYSRQQIVQQAAPSSFSGSGYFGQGVDVLTVQRAYSAFLSSQATQANSALSYLSTYNTQMGSLVSSLGTASTGINQALGNLYSAMSSFSQNPNESATRQAALAAAQSAASAFQSTSAQLATLANGVNSQATSTVAQINQLAQSLADYNDKIGVAYANGGGQAPNELLDQRDALVRQLGALVGISTSTQGNNVNIYLSTGQPLVTGNIPSQLAFDTNDPDSTTGTSLSLTVGGHSMTLNDKDVAGGQLGALLQFRDGELQSAKDQLGQLAISMAAAFNQQQQFGLDASGAQGQALFKLGTPTAVASAGNLGDAKLSVGYADVRSLTGSNYEVSRSGSDYVVTRLSDGTSTSYGSLPQTVDGLTIGLAQGDLADGDTFTVDVTGQAASGMQALLTSSSQLAAAAPMSVTAGAANAGSAQTSALRSVASDTTDYATSVNVVFTSGTGYEVRDADGNVLSTGTVKAPQNTVSYNGWAFDVTGAPAAGDTFAVNVDPGDPAGDNRNALALSSLGTAKVANGGTASLTDAYSSVVATIGTRAASLKVSESAQQTAYDQAVSAEQSLAGVNMDEEGANLLRYQQAYAAAGKVLAMSSDMFSQLLTAITTA